jgi:glycosyltransferase involved in cell wall biosynthesis
VRILLSAYACCPGMGSEPGVGWNWACVLAKRHEVHVLTADRNREPIEHELARNPRPGLTFHYVPVGSWGVWGWLIAWPLYYRWQWRAYRRARKLHKKTAFDLAHHVTYVTWRVPSFLWMLGIPLIWGPVGGAQEAPPGFMAVLGLRGAARELLRTIAQHISRMDPLVRATARHASVILAANTATRQVLPASTQARTQQMLETGVDALRSVVPRARQGGPFRILWVGLLEPRKALPLMLRAMTLLRRDIEVEVSIVGDGPERRRCEALAERWGVSRCTRFVGKVSHRQVQEMYSQADALVFTSLRDTSGNVLLEAMAAGLPIVCLDWSGPGEITTEDCAIRIAPQTPKQVATDLAAAITRLAGDPDLRCQLGSKGRDMVASRHAWHNKAAEMEVVYATAIAGRGAHA